MVKRLSYRVTQVENLALDLSSDPYFDKRKLSNMFPCLLVLILKDEDHDSAQPISNVCIQLHSLDLDFPYPPTFTISNIISVLKNMTVLGNLHFYFYFISSLWILK
ncbi:hypothetical protein K501DRAFT_274600 [Backusella circina FSU 941]|nr:hypothetical protein K501DRAFT_274600 [Backusella circina FSU 941]